MTDPMTDPEERIYGSEFRHLLKGEVRRLLEVERVAREIHEQVEHESDVANTATNGLADVQVTLPQAVVLRLGETLEAGGGEGG